MAEPPKTALEEAQELPDLPYIPEIWKPPETLKPGEIPVLDTPEFLELNRDLEIRRLGMSMALQRDNALRLNKAAAEQRLQAGQAPFEFDDVLSSSEYWTGDVEKYKKALGFQGFTPEYMMTEIGLKGRPVDEVMEELQAQAVGGAATYMLNPQRRKVLTRKGLITKQGRAKLIREGRPIPPELQESGDRIKYRVIAPDDGNPDAEAIVVREGTNEYRGMVQLFNSMFDAETPRGAAYTRYLEDANSSMFNESGLRSFQENIANYETKRWLQKQIDAGRTDLSEMHPEYDQEYARQSQHALKVAALAHTVNRWAAPAWLSWDRVSGIAPPDESDDSWLRKAWNRGSRVRLELVGSDARGVPVYRVTHPVWAMFEMSDLAQSAAVGAVHKAHEWAKESGEDQGTLLNAMSEGALEGLEDKRHFLEYSQDTKAAKSGTAGAWIMGSIGFAGAVLFPDLFVGLGGLAKLAKKTKDGVGKATKAGRLLNKAVDGLEEGAIAEGKAADALARARQAVDANDFDLAEREMLEAIEHMKKGEAVERMIRTEAEFVAQNVDSAAEMIYLRQRRNVPDIAPKDGKPLADQIPGAFGHREENLHPSVRKGRFRGDLEQQLGSFRDFYNQSDTIERLVESLRMVRRGEAEFVGEGARRVLGPKRELMEAALIRRGISRIQMQDNPEIIESVVKFMDFFSEYDSARKLMRDPIGWGVEMRRLAKDLPLSDIARREFFGKKGERGFIDNVIDSTISDMQVFKAAKKDMAPDKASLFKAIGRAISAVEANIETRAASMAIVRDLVASARGIKVDPIMTKAATKFEEVKELSPTAILYRDQIQAAFKMSDGEATAAARVLDMLSVNWAARTHRDPVEYFAETFAPEAFKDKAAFMRRLFKPPPAYVGHEVAAASLPAGYRIEEWQGKWRVLDDADEVLGESADALDAAATAIDKLVELGVMTRHEYDISATRVGPLLLGQPMSVAIDAIHKLKYEHLMVATDNGVHILRNTDNLPSAVGWGIVGINKVMKSPNITWIHNHPNGTTFSDADILVAAIIDGRKGVATQPNGGYWVLDTPEGFGDYSRQVLREKYGSLSAVPADELAKKDEFIREVRQAADDAVRWASEQVRKLNAEEAQEVVNRNSAEGTWAALYSEAFAGKPDANGIFRGGRIGEVLERRGIAHSLYRVGPEDAKVRAGPRSEPTFGESARRAVSEEGLDILFSRATREVPKAAKAVEANLKEGVLARDKTGRVIAQESPEFIDIEKVTRGPRFGRTEEGVLRRQPELDALVDLIEPPGSTSLVNKVRNAWDGMTPEARKVLEDNPTWMESLEGARAANTVDRLERDLKQIKQVATGRPSVEGASVDLLSLTAQVGDDIRHLESILKEQLKHLPAGVNRDEVSHLADLLDKEVAHSARSLFGTATRILDVRPQARDLLRLGSSSRVYKGPNFVWSQVNDATTQLLRRMTETQTLEIPDSMRRADAWLTRLRDEWVDGVPFHKQPAFSYASFDLSDPIQRRTANIAWGALGVKVDDVFETRVVTKQDVIDQINGLPWFHGTKKEQISLLDYSLKYSGDSWGNTGGPGLYLALDPDISIAYARMLYGEERGVLKTVDIRVRDLLDATGSADDVLAQINKLNLGDTELTRAVKKHYDDVRRHGVEAYERTLTRTQDPQTGQELWHRLVRDIGVKEMSRVQEELLDAGIDGVLGFTGQPGGLGHELILFDPNANSLNGAVSTILRESGIRPERFLYQKIARQTEWEMKELGEGLVELTSAEIRAGRAAGEAPAAAKLPEPTAFKEWSGGAPVVEKGGPIPDGPAVVRVFRGSANKWDAGSPYEAREGYAIFASAEPRTAMTYAGPDGVVAPMFAKVDRVIEFDKGAAYGGRYKGTQNFSRVDFDARAKRLRPGEALVVRGVADYKNWESLAPVGLKQGDPHLLNDDIWAFGAGTEFKPQNFLAETQPLLKSTDPQLLKAPSRALEAPAAAKLPVPKYDPLKRDPSTPLPPRIEVWHAGSKRPDVPWDPRGAHLGSGEGFPGGGAMGAGTYFASIEEFATPYLKYGGDKPTISKVVLDTSNFVSTRIKSPKWKRFKKEIAKHVPAEKLEYVHLHNLHDYVSRDVAFKILDDSGITGAYTSLSGRAGNIDEIVVYDRSVIHAAEVAEEVMGGGLVFKVDGDVLRVQSIEIPEVLRGKGVGQELYLKALEHAKSIGKGFASDLAPSPSAIAVYERMIENGAPLTRKMVEAADGKMVQQFVASADDLRRLDPDAVRRVTDDVPPRMLKQDIDDELRGATEFLNTGQAIIYGLNKPSFATFIHEIGHVMRRDLDEKQMDTIVKWLRETEGVEVSARGASFRGSEAARTQAEEKFARAFEVYIHTGEAPQPMLKKIFEQMKEWMIAFYGKIRGLDVTVTPEIKKVFDDMVRQSPPRKPLLSGIAKMLKDELVGPSLKGNIKIRVLNELEREVRKLGHEVDVKDLVRQLDESAAADAAARGIEKGKGIGTITLPVPIYMAGRFPGGKQTFSSNELLEVLIDMQTQRRMTSGPGPRIALKSRAEAIQEMTPTQIIDNFVKSERGEGIKAWARNIMIGGDPIHDMRYLPEEVREAALAVPKRIEQTVGDAVHIVGEGDLDTVIKYLTGEQVFFKDSGRVALSSGHDMMGSVSTQLRRFFKPGQGPLTYDETSALIDFIESIHVHKTAVEFVQDRRRTELAEAAISKITSKSASSPFITEVFQAAGVHAGRQLEPRVFGTPAKPGRASSILEALTYAAGITRRPPEGLGRAAKLDDLKYFEAAQEMDTAQIFSQLYKDMRTPALFGEDPRTANRIVVLIAAYGTADKSMKRWAELGIAVEPKAAVAFKKWVVGEAVDSQAEMSRVLQLYQVHGFSPNFVEGMDMFGLNMYVPSKVRKRLSDSLARATDPSVSDALRGDFLEAIGSGTAVTKSQTWITFAWLYRYLKTRMVRGNFILKTRYFTMNTFDHFNQMAMVTGFRPAFVSTTRMVTQNALSNPLGQSIIVLAGKFGAEGAAEAVRRKLQSAGDVGAHWASRLLMGSKWRVDLNMALEGRGMFRLGANVYSGKHLRDVALETGIFSSFDTSQLGMKIQKSMDLFLEQAKKNDPDLYRKFKRFADPRDLYRVAQDIAEGWSERERFGAMLTLVEMGFEPRVAARITIKALYDYAGSMSKWDRSFIINMFLPFWAFQKNANRQLIDTVFSPWGAYRLGVIRRSWEHGTELISNMMYFDMVDEYGVNTQNLPIDLRDSYYALKLAILEHYGSPKAIPEEVHRDMALFVSGIMTQAALKDSRLYTETEIRNKLMQMGQRRISGYFVPQPNRAHQKTFRRIRPGVAIPHEFTENFSKFMRGIRLNEKSDETPVPYTFLMLPEPVYHAAFHHMGIMTATAILTGYKLYKAPMSMIEEDDGTSELVSPFTPLGETFSPRRAPLISEAIAAYGAENAGFPTRLHESLVPLARSHGIDVFETTPIEDPYATEAEREAALEEGREAMTSAGIIKRKRYYMSPGIGRLLFVNNPIGEYNRLIMGFEKTPLEESAKKGELIRWARGALGLDVEEVHPSRTVLYEKRRAREELGAKRVYEKARKGRPKKVGEK